MVDFKTRFNGRISKVTKDGAFDTVTQTQGAQGITKMPTHMLSSGEDFNRHTQTQIIQYGNSSSGGQGNKS